MNKRLRFVRVEIDGSAPGVVNIPAELEISLKMSAEWYQKAGFQPPWTGYLALDGDAVVGVCAFKTAPQNGAVEIAYGTVEAFRGKGYATQMARQLVELAKGTAPEIRVTAQTLPEKNASGRALEKAGFKRIGELIHPEDGLVWEWQWEASG